MADLTALPLMILVAGPRRSGTDGDPALIAANGDTMARASLELYRRGHLPGMGLRIDGASVGADPMVVMATAPDKRVSNALEEVQ